MTQTDYQRLTELVKSMRNRQIFIINTNIFESEDIIARTLSDESRVFLANVNAGPFDFPERYLLKTSYFKEAFLEQMNRKVFNLTHQQLLDPKFYEYAPLIDDNSVLVINDADQVITSARTAYSMHVTLNFVYKARHLVESNYLAAELFHGDDFLSSGSQSVIYVRNFNLSKTSHCDAFFAIRFRPSAHQLSFLKNRFLPYLTSRYFAHMLWRCCQALEDLLEEKNRIYSRTLSDSEIVYIPDLFLQSLVKDYSLNLEILQLLPQYYDIFLKVNALEPLYHIVSLAQFIYLISTYCDPNLQYYTETDYSVNDYRFYTVNSFHLVVYKQLLHEREHGDISLSTSNGILKLLCSDPLIGIRYVLERFYRIIFVSNNIPFDYKTTNRLVETFSSKCRLNYFNRKSKNPLSTHFFDITSYIAKYIRYYRKGADQMLLTTYYPGLTPQMALNYYKFIDQRTSQSRDGIIVCAPSLHFIAQFAHQLQLQNICIASKYLAFFASQDQASMLTCMRYYYLCCDIGRGGIFVQDCASFKKNQFKNHYNSIALVIGVPFPVKSLYNKLRAFYEASVRQQAADEYWCELAAYNVVKVASGQYATILADMRYGENQMVDLLRYFPRWFRQNLREESPQCLGDLKNWVIQHDSSLL